MEIKVWRNPKEKCWEVRWLSMVRGLEDYSTTRRMPKSMLGLLKTQKYAPHTFTMP